tara:strand:- start:2616 stop:2855 length:240 start_codon:yes stop_codon:yes gene_type:complete
VTKVQIVVTVRKGTLDPEARTIRRALRKSGADIDDLKVGKWFEVEFPNLNKEEALKEAEKIAKNVLSNPVVHQCIIKEN